MNLSLFAIANAFVTVISFGLAAFILFYSRTKLHRLWAGFNITVGTFGLGALLVALAGTYEQAYLSWKLSLLGVSLIATLFYHVTYEFCGMKDSIRLRLVYLHGATFALIVLTTNLAFDSLRYVFNEFYYYRAGVGFNVLFSIWIVVVVASFRNLYRYMRRSEGVDRTRTKYLFWGMLLGFAGGPTTSLPSWGVDVYPAWHVFICFYALVCTYAILRYQLLDIEVVVRRTAVFAGMAVGMMAMIAAPTLIAQNWLSGVAKVHPVALDLVGVLLIMLTYERMKRWLMEVTDHFLFQKRYDFREVLKQFTDEIVVGIKDLKQLAETSVKRLAEAVRVDNCQLLLLNHDTQKYELVASAGVNGRQLVVEADEPFIAFMKQTHEPIGRDGQLGKVNFPEAVTKRLDELQARLCMPLYIGVDFTGVLCFGKKKSDEEFTKDDIDTLSTAANALAVSVANAVQAEELSKTQALAAQKEKLAVIGTLSAGINHEICNPLGIVKAQCESFLLDLQDGILMGKSAQELTDRVSSIMQVALKQIDRATAITQKLSSFAKPIKSPTMQPVPVEQEIDEVLMLVGHDLKLERIEVKKEIPPDLPEIVVDRRQLQEVLFNLIRNAGQAIAPPGSITIRAATGEGRVRIEIEDTGTGIPPDKLGKIFDPFFTTKEPGKGTGLGLFIVRQIVERNKGRITLESTVGKGTTFQLEFPAAASAELAMAR